MHQRVLSVFVGIIIMISSQVSLANVVGNDLQNFNANSNGLDFVTVHSSDTLDPFVFNFGTFFTFATNSLPYFQLPSAPPSGQEPLEPEDMILANGTHIGIGIIRGWDIGIHANSVVSQNIDNSAFLGTYAKTGLIDLRLSTKLRLHNGESNGFAVASSVDFDRVVSNPFVGDNAGPTVNVELIYDHYFSSWVRWGFNLGYRLRAEGNTIPNTGVTPLEDQVTYSTALSFEMTQKFAILGEIFGSYPTTDTRTPTDRNVSNLQTIGGFRYKFDGNVDIHGGVGTEIYHGIGTPDILVYTGINWRLGAEKDQPPPAPVPTIEPVTIGDSDNDGVMDDVDQCPATPPNTEVNNIGCSIKKVEDITLDNLNFFTDTAKLTPNSESKVDTMVKRLQEGIGDIQKIVVEGHTDSRGSDDYNLDLSQRRAQTIADLLVEKVPLKPDQVVAMGKGETQPIASNETKEGRLRNRRVELRVIHIRDQQ